MREIKFRAWSHEYKEMYTSDFDDAVVPEDRPLFHTGLDASGELFAGHFLADGDFEDLILMQYTGLKDKNGKEVYEGDVIKTPNGFIGKVVFKKHEYVHGKVLYQCTGWIFEREYGHCEFMDDEIIQGEVIGNTHENPELLK